MRFSHRHAGPRYRSGQQQQQAACALLATPAPTHSVVHARMHACMQMWKSPNGTIRNILNGTVFR